MAAFFSANYLWAYPLFGVFIGVFAGLTGLGGGAVLVPLLVLAFGKQQAEAQGTSLAMIFSPAAVPAIYRYHKEALIDWWMVVGVAPFMLVGSYFGAMFAVNLPQALLRSMIAIILIYVAAYMLFGKALPVGRAVLFSFVPVVVTFALALGTGVFSKAVKSAPAEKADSAASVTTPAATMPADDSK